MLTMKNSDEKSLWSDLIYLFSQWSLPSRKILNTEDYLSELCRRLCETLKVGKINNAMLGNYKHIYLHSTQCAKYVTHTHPHHPGLFVCIDSYCGSNEKISTSLSELLILRSKIVKEMNINPLISRDKQAEYQRCISEHSK